MNFIFFYKKQNMKQSKFDEIVNKETENTTISEKDITKGEYVDLGLPSGLLWASCNLGANTPYEYAKFFQWGDTVGYTDGSHSTFETTPFNNGSGKFDSVYFEANKTQWLDEHDILKPEYDAVYVATGGKAHMPTEADFNELTDGFNTTKEWCTCVVLGDDHKEHNVNGCLFTSKVNGNNIFIPTEGREWGGSPEYKGDTFLWSSSLFENSHGYAYGLYLNSDNYGDSDDYGVYGFLRAYGFSVRGVKSSN